MMAQGNCNFEIKVKRFKTFCYRAYAGRLWSIYRVNVYSIKVHISLNNVYRKLFNVRRGESISALFRHFGILYCQYSLGLGWNGHLYNCG